MDRAAAEISVLISSPNPKTSGELQASLRANGLRCVVTNPGASFLDLARRERPRVAVLDSVDERSEAAQMEIQLLKELRQDVRIIVVSRKPSPQDAWVVEQGVFFYMTTPSANQLLRVVQAAAGVTNTHSVPPSLTTTILCTLFMVSGVLAAQPEAQLTPLAAQPAEQSGAQLAAQPAAQPSAQPAPLAAKAAAKPQTKTDTCASANCHADLMSHKFMHGPTAQQKCLACHQYDEPREHRFKFASDQSKLCADCHAIKQRTVVHKPVSQGRCTGCHDPHGSEFRANLKSDPTRGLCLTCHKENFADKKFIHGPVNAGACILCHDPHSSWQAKLLVDTPDKLCKGCHAELIPKGDQARHVHAPVAQGNCTACHDPHASNAKYQLRAAAPDLCTGCHKEMTQLLTASHVVHGAVKEAAGGCTACHAPHFSSLPKLQKAPQPESCLKCHDKPLQTADGKTLTDMATLLKENPSQHGPIREGACTACHQPHAGENFRLLAANYPPEFYAPFKIDNYSLCFKCHIPDLVLNKNGSGLTRFRNGELNLHWVHVNKEKGRTCRACHEVHASKNPFHIRDAVPFGNKDWMLEIKYKQSANGGSCSPGCHAEKTYDRGDSGQRSAPPPAPAAAPTVPPAPVTSTLEGTDARNAAQSVLAR